MCWAGLYRADSCSRPRREERSRGDGIELECTRCWRSRMCGVCVSLVMCQWSRLFCLTTVACVPECSQRRVSASPPGVCLLNDVCTAVLLMINICTLASKTASQPQPRDIITIIELRTEHIDMLYRFCKCYQIMGQYKCGCVFRAKCSTEPRM